MNCGILKMRDSNEEEKEKGEEEEEEEKNEEREEEEEEGEEEGEEVMTDLLLECSIKLLHPHLIKVAKPLTEEAIETLV